MLAVWHWYGESERHDHRRNCISEVEIQMAKEYVQ